MTFYTFIVLDVAFSLLLCLLFLKNSSPLPYSPMSVEVTYYLTALKSIFYRLQYTFLILVLFPNNARAREPCEYNSLPLINVPLFSCILTQQIYFKSQKTLCSHTVSIPLDLPMCL